jgi:hypothetical protein
MCDAASVIVTVSFPLTSATLAKLTRLNILQLHCGQTPTRSPWVAVSGRYSAILPHGIRASRHRTQ